MDHKCSIPHALFHKKYFVSAKFCYLFFAKFEIKYFAKFRKFHENKMFIKNPSLAPSANTLATYLFMQFEYMGFPLFLSNSLQRMRS